tara:strand:+ start:501 stop:740 length:240 start_codon:yes stop_codon:yes gene_type:complete
MNVKNRVYKIFDQIFELNGSIIEDGWTSDDISKWDSLGHLNLMSGLEEDFNITFDIEEMFAVDSVSDCINIINKKIKDT